MASKLRNKNENDVRLGKNLSYLLRHGAVKEGLSISPQGFISVDEILETKNFRRYTVEDIVKIVADSDKQRFTINKTDGGALVIKANQGHSLHQVNDLGLKLVDNPTFDIIHGTYFHCWKKIKAEGLSRMRRTHIHFSKGRNFTCGLRRNAEIFITVDFHLAKSDGVKFYESENEVVLCSGDSKGYLDPKYFSKVVTANGTKLH